MWAYRIKKWGMRLCLIALLFAVVIALAKVDLDHSTWQHGLVTFLTMLAPFGLYQVFKPLKPAPPADGFRSDLWQEEIAANEHSIRAALLTSHPNEYSKVILIQPDKRCLEARRWRGGWELMHGRVGERFDAIAVRSWGGCEPETVQFEWYKVFSRSLEGDAFGNRDC